MVVICVGVGLFYGCKNGVCGFCKGKLVLGEVEYGLYQVCVFLEYEQQLGYVLFCVVKLYSDVIIEVCEVVGVGEILVCKLLVCVVKLDKVVDDVIIFLLQLLVNDCL